MIAICADKIADSRRVKEKNGLPFDILGDEKLEVISAYGLLFHEPMRNTDIALPANFLLDREGKIVWKWISPRVQDRVDPSVVEAEVEKLLNSN